jgi:hypothetical protein
MARCSSIPAIGTTKSDEEAVARAKMTAVAALQRLFFEEMSKGGVEANDAAARALLRLTESHTSQACASACLINVSGPESEPSPSASAEFSTPNPQTVAQGDKLVGLPNQLIASGMQRCVPQRPMPIEGRHHRTCSLIRASLKV